NAGVGIDLNQAQLSSTVVVAGKPVQQLEQLQLIIQVVFEPQHDLLVLAGQFECAVAVGKSGAEVFVNVPAKAGQSPRANIRKFAQRGGFRNRAVMQNVAPGKVSARKSDLPEGTNDRISVGNVQHVDSLTQTRRAKFLRETKQPGMI